MTTRTGLKTLAQDETGQELLMRTWVILCGIWVICFFYFFGVDAILMCYFGDLLATCCCRCIYFLLSGCGLCVELCKQRKATGAIKKRIKA